MAKRRPKKGFFCCPHCRGRVRRGAPACPHCGSDRETGWAPDAHKWAANIPAGYSEDDFDYDEYIEDEFPDDAPRRKWGLGLHLFWLVAAVAAVVALVYLVVTE
jgi:hypothetical protein